MLEIIIAFALDLFLGDPVYDWHPIRIIGRWVEWSETWLRKQISREKTAGLCQAVAIPPAVFLLVWFLTTVASQIQPFLGRVLTIYFLYSSLSIKDLASEARKVSAALRKGNLEAARKNLGRIVGRDTQNLSEPEIIRGTVETVAESYMDGILAPLFYAALGGAPLALAYKAVNTLDSMVGKRSPRYREFGFFAAKIDEVINWVPARITWFLIGLAAFLVNGRGVEAWRVGLEDGAAAPVSNSIVPEAAFAGALGVELGGKNYYSGKGVDTPKMGYPMRPLERENIRVAITLMQASAWVSLAFALILRYLVSLLYS